MDRIFRAFPRLQTEHLVLRRLYLSDAESLFAILSDEEVTRIGFGFRECGLNRIQALVMPGNEASERLLEKLGFQKEGVLREYENWGRKGHVDLSVYSLLRHEYRR